MEAILPANGCRYSADNEFGPRVATACRDFDFTLLFEDAVFVALPAAVFLLLLPWRLPAVIVDNANQNGILVRGLVGY